jgi:hypothetical protein
MAALHLVAFIVGVTVCLAGVGVSLLAPDRRRWMALYASDTFCSNTYFCHFTLYDMGLKQAFCGPPTCSEAVFLFRLE